MYEGLIIRALMDNRMITLDAKTGKDVWHVKSPEPVTHANGYSMTGAPLIAKKEGIPAAAKKTMRLQSPNVDADCTFQIRTEGS
jgi:PQQ enzyme repeat